MGIAADTRACLESVRSRFEIHLRCLLPAVTVITGQRLWGDALGLDWSGVRVVRVDLAGVETADTALVAILIGIARHAQVRGASLSVSRSSRAVDSLLSVHSLSVLELNRIFACV
jgi:ABC-type transporter Mla MlaB component